MDASLSHTPLSAVAASTLRRWWNNPLLRHARHRRPPPGRVVGRGLAIAAGGLALLTVLAWAAQWRWIGAALMGVSAALVLLPPLVAAVVSADRVSRQMRFTYQDPRGLADLDPDEVAWGLALVTLWQMRWLIGAALALTPALVIGLLRLDVSRFQAMQATATLLGSVADLPAGTLPDGRVPYIRLSMRALSAGLLPWMTLPLTASLGVTAALLLQGDTPLSSLVSLLGNTLAGALLGGLWQSLAWTPALAGMLEVVRLVLLGGLLFGLGAVTVWITQWNAGLLSQVQRGSESIP